MIVDIGTAIRWIHVFAGGLTLLVMPIPMVTRKGGKTHRRAGWVFVAAMALLCVSSAWICFEAFFDLHSPSVTGRTDALDRPFAALLFMVTVLTGHGVFSALRVLRHKKRTGPLRDPLNLAFSAVLGLLGVIMAVWGALDGSVLVVGFSALSVYVAYGECKLLATVPDDPRYWWYVHMDGMMGGVLGALTAFLIINTELLPEAVLAAVPRWVFWLGPSIIGFPLIARWRAHYRRRFAGGA